MKVKTVIITSVVAATVGVAAVQSCTAIATSAIGVAVIKRVLLGGVSKGVKVLKNKNEFLQSPLIDSAMPSGLKKMNSVLGKTLRMSMRTDEWKSSHSLKAEIW